MPRRASEHPTELELEILKVLWELPGPSPVREIRQALAEEGRKLAHTTVLTTLNVMAGKKYLKRSMRGNACLFEPRLSREQVSTRMLGDLVDRVFDGSASAVVLRLFDCADVQPGDIEELKRIIREKSGEKTP